MAVVVVVPRGQLGMSLSVDEWGRRIRVVCDFLTRRKQSH